jgi:uncharacterized OsmC-like protein
MDMASQTTKLATGSVTSQLTNQPGRAIVAARGNHFVVDSVPALGGPNETLNSMDLLMAALATCATFICETAAQEFDIPLHDITVTTAGDFDARGLCNPEINPHVQAFRVRLALKGPTEAQAQRLLEAFQGRCPVYTTLSRSAPTHVEVVLG